MRVTQGAFSFLPDLTETQVRAQIQYCLDQGWAPGIEYTDDPHPRNTYWEMWAQPLFDLKDAAGVMQEIKACREAWPDHYVRINAFDAGHGWETVRLSFIVQRPAREPGFKLSRTVAQGRVLSYRTEAYALDRPEGERHG